VSVQRAKELLCRGRPNDVLGLRPKLWVRKREGILRREWAGTYGGRRGDGKWKHYFGYRSRKKSLPELDSQCPPEYID